MTEKENDGIYREQERRGEIVKGSREHATLPGRPLLLVPHLSALLRSMKLRPLRLVSIHALLGRGPLFLIFLPRSRGIGATVYKFFGFFFTQNPRRI